jgi:hypothetical protein
MILLVLPIKNAALNAKAIVSMTHYGMTRIVRLANLLAEPAEKAHLFG